MIVTASFEGEPADNAARFVAWVSGMRARAAHGVAFALFGCGNSDWVATYQRVPRLIDRVLVERGAERLVGAGEGDAAGDGFFEAFDAWEARLWETLAEVRRLLARRCRVGPKCRCRGTIPPLGRIPIRSTLLFLAPVLSARSPFDNRMLRWPR